MNRVLALVAILLAACTSPAGGPPPSGVGDRDGGPTDGSGAGPGDGAAVDAPSDGPPADVEPPTGIPEWEDLPFQVAGCTVQRLANASELDLFNWKACAGLADCTEAVWHRGLIADGEISRRTVVDDDGRIIRVGVAYHSNATWEDAVFVALEDGAIQLGLRVSTVGGLCHMTIPALGHGRFGTLVIQLKSDAGPLREGGLLAALDDPSALTAFEIDPLPPGSGPDYAAMGSSRWLWRFAPAQLTTFSNVDGSGFTIFAKISASILELSYLTSTGPSFLFDVLEAPDGRPAEAYIGRSDGVAPMETFLKGSPGSWVGAPMFAHSHVGWQRGINPQAINKFDAVELWASPYSEDPGALAPYKVGDLQVTSWGPMCAGWGRYATPGKPELNTQHDLLVWDLEKKTSHQILLPADRYYEACAGLTRSAFWLVPGLVSSSQRGLMRFMLP